MRPLPLPPSRPTLVRAAIATVAAAVVAAGVAAPAAGAGASGRAPVSDRAPAPPISWGPCDPALQAPAGYQCATYQVPLDYDRPRGEQVGLALIKRPADGTAARRGTVFLNPGGPGGSGVATVAAAGENLFGADVNARFDVVGVDPRGIAGSDQLRCWPDALAFADFLGRYAPAGLWPTDDAGWQAQRTYQREYNRACETSAGSILDHMSTANVARDLDVLRRAVGDDKLTYVGYSYGSYLGATYANLYPSRVGAVVVDGVLDPVAWATGRGPEESRRVPFTTRIRSGEGADATLAEFMRLCDAAGPDRCAFAGDAAARYDLLVKQLGVTPVQLDIPGLGTLVLDDQVLTSLVLGILYDSAGWGLLGEALAGIEALAATGGTPVAAAAATGPASDGAAEPVVADDLPYPGDEGFRGVACSDALNPAAFNRYRADVDAAASISPLRASWAILGAGCWNWPGRDGDAYRGPFTARTSNTVLVVNTTFDPATPYSGALALRSLLPSSRLVTVEGWGHTTTGLSQCSREIVDRYLVTRRAPRSDVTCAQDVDPFPALTTVPATTSAAAPGGAFAAGLDPAIVDALVAVANGASPGEIAADIAHESAEAAAAAGDAELAERLDVRGDVMGEAGTPLG